MGRHLDDENYCQGCDEYLEEIEKNYCSCEEGPFCETCLEEHEQVCIEDEEIPDMWAEEDFEGDDDEDFYDDDPNDDYFD